MACYGLNYVLFKKLCWCPNPPVPQNVTVFGDKVFTKVIKRKGDCQDGH